MRSRALAPLLVTSVLCFSSCGNSAANTPEPTSTRVHKVVDRFAYIALGDGKRLPHVAKDDKGYKPLGEIDIQDLTYPNKEGSEHLPVLTKYSALRLRTQVSLDNNDAKLSNDEACDIVKVEEGVRSIAAVSLGGDDTSYVYWPDKSYVHICFPQNEEPNSVVLDPNPPSQ